LWLLTVTVWMPFSLSFAMSDADTPTAMRDVQTIPNVKQLTMSLNAINVNDYKPALGNVSIGWTGW
jgi:hypothetical protein